MGSLVASQISDSSTTSTTTKPEDESTADTLVETVTVADDNPADVTTDANTLLTSSGSGVVTDAGIEEVEYPLSEDVGEIDIGEEESIGDLIEFGLNVATYLIQCIIFILQVTTWLQVGTAAGGCYQSKNVMKQQDN